jgi:hypothetical protein
LIASASETEAFRLPGIPDLDLSRAKVEQILAELDVS